jgi:23S rRNA maturation mini-RNase III
MRRTPIVGQNSKLIAPAYEEYYLYNLAGMTTGTMTQGVKIAKDSICYVHSGNLDARNRMVLSHLHKAIKPLNQLRMLEDAVVIYRLARAPERRIFYIDVGNLPKAKAEQYVRDMMVRHKNRLVYDADTGAVKDSRKFMTMLEDYWLPRREGGRGTEITTLPGGENLGQMDDVEYFRKKLYKSLGVPVSRLEPEGSFSLGRGSEISRDEIKFAKFIERLRDRFSHMFDNLLEIQLILTGVMTRGEWKEMKNDIGYRFARDNYYAELKEQDMINNRLAVLGVADAYVGKYVSAEWVRKHILHQTEEDIAEIDKQNAAAPEPEQDEAQSQQYDLAMRDMDIKNKEMDIRAASLGSNKKPEAEPKVSGDKKVSTKNEQYEAFEPKPLTEEDKRLIENMTRAIEKVSKEDIEEVEEIKDAL